MARVLPIARVVLLVAAVAALAAARPQDGPWLALPVALALAAAEPSRRLGLAAGLAVGLGAVAGAGGAPAAALVAVPASLVVLLGVRARLERERDEMRRSALRDPLTGVFNRRAIDERLRYEIVRHTRQRETFVVLVLDLDGFKPVNDRFGHDAGDELLRDVAGALLGLVRAQDTVARLGGDEFCVLAPATNRAGAAHLNARIHRAMDAMSAGVHGVSATIGTAIFPADGATAGALLGAADADLIEGKHRLYAQHPGRRRAA